MLRAPAMTLRRKLQAQRFIEDARSVQVGSANCHEIQSCFHRCASKFLIAAQRPRPCNKRVQTLGRPHMFAEAAFFCTRKSASKPISNKPASNSQAPLEWQ